ncbi:MAG: hypothetical protein K2M94_02100 [Paramuribaculum sp.]|nr:hypothetical protein [Paramuribaculum sp.]
MLNPLRIIITLLLTAATLNSTAAPTTTHTDSTATATANAEYERLAQRAQRFFHYREWSSAGAMYTLMLQKHPDVCDTYAHAIVAAEMLDDTLHTSQLTVSALNSRIPVDSLFSGVEKISFSIGRTSLYERYLLFTQRNQSWLSRIIDTYLMRYYTYRRYGPGMVRYSSAILSRLPDDIAALYTLAQGYLITGETTRAIDTYLRITTLDPQQYLALLYLGNYYASKADNDPAARHDAIIYLTRAHNLHPTPYTESALRKLIP